MVKISLEDAKQLISQFSDIEDNKGIQREIVQDKQQIAKKQKRSRHINAEKRILLRRDREKKRRDKKRACRRGVEHGELDDITDRSAFYFAFYQVF